jgi:hypothetical protein
MGTGLGSEWVTPVDAPARGTRGGKCEGSRARGGRTNSVRSIPH